MFKFEIIKQSKKSRARVAQIVTPHGNIITPAFLAVATQGIVKGGVDFEDLEKINLQAQIINTFHLFDLGVVPLIKKAGGVHNFFNFPKPIFSDSGGFQILSLGKRLTQGLGKIFVANNNFFQPKKGLVKILKTGVFFNSPRDGTKVFLTPEKVLQIQQNLGVDFAYLLDICGTPFDDYQTAKKEMELTHQWFLRALKLKRKKNQEIFAIIQGGVYQDLREKATEFVNQLDVFGIAIGGALGKTKKELYQIINWVNKKIDFSRPHHLLGIGSLDSLEKIISLGVDLFDCTQPTRLARHATALTSKGEINLKKSSFKKDFKPLEKKCQCPTCQNWSKSQIHYLLKAKEMLAIKLLTLHNLFFLEEKLKKVREKILMSKL